VAYFWRKGERPIVEAHYGLDGPDGVKFDMTVVLTNRGTVLKREKEVTKKGRLKVTGYERVGSVKGFRPKAKFIQKFRGKEGWRVVDVGKETAKLAKMWEER
jgi:hypothetical protein